MTSQGLHHVTAIAGPPARSLDFYTRVLGLRLVKKTVNFDDPGTYHLYFGDESGSPGTILTFFPWPHATPGRTGIGETFETQLRIPEAAIGYWAHRFVTHGVAHDALVKRFGETVLAFKDPDGMRLALVGQAGIAEEQAWHGGGVPTEFAIRGFNGVSLLLENTERTVAILTDVFGYRRAGSDDSVARYRTAKRGPGTIIDLRQAGGFLPARMGAGSVHHIAFRAKDDAAQAEMVQRLVRDHAMRVTEQKDRNYFRSVYFREPGGILFEIATDSPGFAVDEPAAALGHDLKLPGFLEARRDEIEARLPVLETA